MERFYHLVGFVITQLCMNSTINVSLFPVVTKYYDNLFS